MDTIMDITMDTVTGTDMGLGLGKKIKVNLPQAGKKTKVNLA